MFNNNWYNALLAVEKNSSSSIAKCDFVAYDGTALSNIQVVSSVSSSSYDILQLFLDGNSNAHSPNIKFLSNGSLMFYGNSSNANTVRGVLLGDGDIPPSLTDYCLSGNMITDFTATTAVATSYSNGKIIGTATYNVINTGASPFTVKEIANTFARSSTRIMIARSLLEIPVTIQPGDTGVIIYRVEIS